MPGLQHCSNRKLFCRFTDNVTKDGDVIKYTINVRKLYEPGEIITLVRDYEDIQVRRGAPVWQQNVY